MNSRRRRLLEQPATLDEQSFKELVDHFSRQIFALAFRMVNNESDAEEVVQDTFLKAWRNRHTFAGRSQVKTWLFSIATYTALDLIRKRKPLDALDPAETAAPGQRGQDHAMVDKEIHQRVVAGIQALAPKERAAFVLRHCEGYSINEICDITGLGAGSTKQAVFRAVHKLRNALQVRS